MQINFIEIPLHIHWDGCNQKDKLQQVLSWMWRSWDSRKLLVGILNGEDALELGERTQTEKQK